MGLRHTLKMSTGKKIFETANIIWNMQNEPALQLRVEELKVMHGEYNFKLRKGIPVDYIFDISGAGPEGEKIDILLKSSDGGTEIRITSRSFLPTDVIARPGNNRENAEEIAGYLKGRL